MKTFIALCIASFVIAAAPTRTSAADKGVWGYVSLNVTCNPKGRFGEQTRAKLVSMVFGFCGMELRDAILQDAEPYYSQAADDVCGPNNWDITYKYVAVSFISEEDAQNRHDKDLISGNYSIHKEFPYLWTAYCKGK